MNRLSPILVLVGWSIAGCGPDPKVLDGDVKRHGSIVRQIREATASIWRLEALVKQAEAAHDPGTKMRARAQLMQAQQERDAHRQEAETLAKTISERAKNRYRIEKGPDGIETFVKI